MGRGRRCLCRDPAVPVWWGWAGPRSGRGAGTTAWRLPSCRACPARGRGARTSRRSALPSPEFPNIPARSKLVANFIYFYFELIGIVASAFQRDRDDILYLLKILILMIPGELTPNFRSSWPGRYWTLNPPWSSISLPVSMISSSSWRKDEAIFIIAWLFSYNENNSYLTKQKMGFFCQLPWFFLLAAWCLRSLCPARQLWRVLGLPESVSPPPWLASLWVLGWVQTLVLGFTTKNKVSVSLVILLTVFSSVLYLHIFPAWLLLFI